MTMYIHLEHYLDAYPVAPMRIHAVENVKLSDSPSLNNLSTQTLFTLLWDIPGMAKTLRQELSLCTDVEWLDAYTPLKFGQEKVPDKPMMCSYPSGELYDAPEESRLKAYPLCPHPDTIRAALLIRQTPTFLLEVLPKDFSSDGLVKPLTKSLTNAETILHYSDQVNHQQLKRFVENLGDERSQIMANNDSGVLRFAKLRGIRETPYPLSPGYYAFDDVTNSLVVVPVTPDWRRYFPHNFVVQTKGLI